MTITCEIQPDSDFYHKLNQELDYNELAQYVQPDEVAEHMDPRCVADHMSAADVASNVQFDNSRTIREVLHEIQSQQFDFVQLLNDRVERLESEVKTLRAQNPKKWWEFWK